MARLRCIACGGEFDAVTPDKMRYFHACPPLSASEIRRGLDAGTIILSAGDQKKLLDARASDAEAFALGREGRAEEFFLSSLGLQRPQARDENVDLVKAKAALDDRGRRKPGVTDESLMLASGAGVTVVP